MELILNRVYRLSGRGFYEGALAENNNLFKLTKIKSNGEWVFEGVKTFIVQWSSQEMINDGEAEIALVGEIKQKGSKRKKGSRRKVATVNKATILFMSGEQYTVKDFVSIEANSERVIFIMEDNYKGTVNYRQAITVPNDDVAEVKVRGVKHQFVLDMALTNMGVVVFQADGVEIFSTELNMTV